MSALLTQQQFQLSPLQPEATATFHGDSATLMPELIPSPLLTTLPFSQLFKPHSLVTCSVPCNPDSSQNIGLCQPQGKHPKQSSTIRLTTIEVVGQPMDSCSIPISVSVVVKRTTLEPDSLHGVKSSLVYLLAMKYWVHELISRCHSFSIYKMGIIKRMLLIGYYNRRIK